MTRLQRQLGFIAAALLVSAGIYGMRWQKAADEAKTQFEGFIERQRGDGLQIAHDGIESRGFPFSVELAVANLKVNSRDSFVWQAPEKLIVAVSPLAPLHLTVKAPGSHVIEAYGQRYAVTLGEADVTLDAGEAGLSGLHVGLATAEVDGGWKAPVAIAGVTLDFTRADNLAKDDLTTPSMALSLGLREARLPPALNLPLGEMVSGLGLRLSLKGPAPNALARQEIAAWAEAGGILEVEALHIDYPPLLIEGDGALALDRNLLPIAPFGLKTKGAAEVLDRLAKEDFVDEAILAAIREALSKAPADPNSGMTLLPLTVQGQGVYLDAAKIADLPEMPWLKE